MSRVIKLRWPATCRTCAARIPRHTEALYHGRNDIECLRCANGTPELTPYELGDRSPGAIASHYDPHGVYSYDGRKLGSSCSCEDYPCCGH
jgi:hypothetical protein